MEQNVRDRRIIYISWVGAILVATTIALSGEPIYLIAIVSVAMLTFVFRFIAMKYHTRISDGLERIEKPFSYISFSLFVLFLATILWVNLTQ